MASDGKEALDILERDSCDLILMDIQMPRMSGFDVTNVIREKEKIIGEHIPIIATTAYAMNQDKEICLSAGMDDYLSKPLDIQKFHEIVDKWIKRYNLS